VTDRVPPNSPETERSVLGSCMLGRDIVASALHEGLTGSDFYVSANKLIWETVCAIFDKGDEPDIVTISDALGASGRLSMVGGTPYLSELSNVASAPNLGPWVAILKSHSLRRNMIDIGTTLQDKAFNLSLDPSDVRAETENALMDTGTTGSGLEKVGDHLPAFFESVEAYSSGVIAGIKTGFDKLDTMTGGFMNGDLIVLAGRPSMGKSAFALAIALNAAKTVPVALFSLEMSRKQLIERMMCMEAKVEMHRLRAGTLPQRDVPKLSTAAGPVYDAPIYIDDTAGITLSQIRAQLLRKPVGLVVIDYLQLMNGPGSSTQDMVSRISRGLKEIAKGFDVPVVALSQLSRAVEQRGGDHRPMLSDLRESGAIEQDADAVLFMYRGEYYFKDDERLKGKAEVIVSKQRNGPTGWAGLAWIAAYARFENLADPEPTWEQQ